MIVRKVVKPLFFQLSVGVFCGVLICGCAKPVLPFPYEKQFAFISFKKNPSQRLQKKHRFHLTDQAYFFEKLDSTLLDKVSRENFPFTIADADHGYRDFYFNDSLIVRLLLSEVYTNPDKSRFLLEGRDTVNRVTLYADKTNYAVFANKNAYRFLGDTIIFTDQTNLGGWDNNRNFKPPVIYKLNNALTGADTLFTLPGNHGLLANAVPIDFDVVDGRWIWEWTGQVYMQNDHVNRRYKEAGSMKHYTFLNGREFFFYYPEGYEEGYAIHVDQKPFGKLGYSSIIPIYSPKSQVKFLARKGFLFYKISLK